MTGLQQCLYSLGALGARLTLGALFVFAGYRKLMPDGEVMRILENAKAFADAYVVPNAPNFLSADMAYYYGVTLPFMEILAGALLAIGLLGRLWALIISLMLLSFIMAFGVNWWPAGEGPAFNTNIVLMSTAVWLFLAGPGKISIDGIFGAIFCRKKTESPAAAPARPQTTPLSEPPKPETAAGVGD